MFCCGADKALKAQVPQLLDKAEHLPQDMLSGGPARVLTLQIYLRCSGTVPLTDVTLTMEAPAGLHLSQVTFTLQDTKVPIMQPLLVLYFIKGLNFELKLIGRWMVCCVSAELHSSANCRPGRWQCCQCAAASNRQWRASRQHAISCRHVRNLLRRAPDCKLTGKSLTAVHGHVRAGQLWGRIAQIALPLLWLVGVMSAYSLPALANAVDVSVPPAESDTHLWLFSTS